jgi:hypothetical protein
MPATSRPVCAPSHRDARQVSDADLKAVRDAGYTDANAMQIVALVAMYCLTCSIPKDFPGVTSAEGIMCERNAKPQMHSGKDCWEHVWAFPMYRQARIILAPHQDYGLSPRPRMQTICISAGSNGEIKESLPRWRAFSSQGDERSIIITMPALRREKQMFVRAVDFCTPRQWHRFHHRR